MASLVDKAKALVLLKDGLGPLFQEHKDGLVQEALKLPLAEAAGALKQFNACGLIDGAEFSALSTQLITMVAGGATSSPAVAQSVPIATTKDTPSPEPAAPAHGSELSVSTPVAEERASTSGADTRSSAHPWGALKITLATRISTLQPGTVKQLKEAGVDERAADELVGALKNLGADTVEKLLELDTNNQNFNVLEELMSAEQLHWFEIMMEPFRELDCVARKQQKDQERSMELVKTMEREARMLEDTNNSIFLFWGDAMQLLVLSLDNRVHFYCEVEPDRNLSDAEMGERVYFYLDISASMNHDDQGVYCAPKSPDHPASSMRKARNLIPQLAIPALKRFSTVTVVVWNYIVQQAIEFQPSTFLAVRQATATEGDGDGDDDTDDLEQFIDDEDMERLIRDRTNDAVFRAKGGTNIEAALEHMKNNVVEEARKCTQISVWFLTDGEETVYVKSNGDPDRIPSNPSHSRFNYFSGLDATGLTQYHHMMAGRLRDMRMQLSDCRCNIDVHICHFGEADPIFLREIRSAVEGHFHAIRDVDSIAAEMGARATGSGRSITISSGTNGAEQTVRAAIKDERLCSRGILPREFAFDELVRRGAAFVRTFYGQVCLANSMERIELPKTSFEGVSLILSLEPQLSNILQGARRNVSASSIERAAEGLRRLRTLRSQAVGQIGRAVTGQPILVELLEATLESVQAQTEALERLCLQYQKPVSETYDKVAAKRAEMFTAREQQAIAAGLESMQVRLGYGFVAGKTLDKRIQRLVADHGARARRMLARVCIVGSTDDEASGFSDVTLCIVEGSEYRDARAAVVAKLCGTNSASNALFNTPGRTIALDEERFHKDGTLRSKLCVTVKCGGKEEKVQAVLDTFDVYPRRVGQHSVRVRTTDLDSFNKRFMDPLSYSGCMDLIGECYTLPARLYTVAPNQSAGLVYNAKEMMHVLSGGMESTSFEYFRLFWRLEGKSGDTREVTVPGTFHSANAALPMAPEPITNLVLANVLTGLVSEFITGTCMAPLPAIGNLYIGYLLMHMRKEKPSGVDIARIADILATIAVWIDNPRTNPRPAEVRDMMHSWMTSGKAIPKRDSPGKFLPVKAIAYLLTDKEFPAYQRYNVLVAEAIRRYSKLLIPTTVQREAKLPEAVINIQQPAREFMRWLVDELAESDELVDDVPVHLLDAGDKLYKAVQGGEAEVLEFMNDLRNRRVVVKAVHTVLHSRVSASFSRYLHWQNFNRFMYVWSAVASYSVDHLLELFAQFKSPEPFEEWVEGRTQCLADEDLSWSNTLVSWASPQAGSESAEAGTHTAPTVVHCLNAVMMPDFPEMLEVKTIPTGESRMLDELGDEERNDAYLRLWGAFKCLVDVWPFRGRRSTCYNILEIDYDVVEALKAENPGPLLEKMGQMQVSEYHSAVGRKNKKYAQWVPEPEPIPHIDIGEHFVARQLRRDPSAKPRIALVVIGNVDSGKSTTSGHLISQLGFIDQRIIREYEKACRAIGREMCKYAWIMDRLREERARGLTIEVSLWNVMTKNYEVDILDAPGHRCFVKNMAAGASFADVGVLLLSAAHGEFEAGIVRGGMTRQELVIAYSTGVKQFIVMVNKMDLVGYSEERYNEVRAEMTRIMKRVGVKTDSVPFIPCSGYHGHNLTHRAEAEMPWFQGCEFTQPDQGKVVAFTLQEAIDVLTPPKRAVTAPLRVPIQQAYKISGIGTVAVGRVSTGVLKTGDKVVLNPGGLRADVTSIEIHHCSKGQVGPGDIVGFKVKGVSVGDVKRGMVASLLEERPLHPCESFEAQVIILDHPGRIRAGYAPFMFCHVGSFPCRFAEILEKSDKRGQNKEAHPQFIQKGDSAIVRMVPLKPICVEPFSTCPPLGRFVVRDINTTVAVGVVRSVVFADEGSSKAKPSRARAARKYLRR